MSTNFERNWSNSIRDNSDNVINMSCSPPLEVRKPKKFNLIDLLDLVCNWTFWSHIRRLLMNKFPLSSSFVIANWD